MQIVDTYQVQFGGECRPHVRLVVDELLARHHAALVKVRGRAALTHVGVLLARVETLFVPKEMTKKYSFDFDRV